MICMTQVPLSSFSLWNHVCNTSPCAPDKSIQDHMLKYYEITLALKHSKAKIRQRILGSSVWKTGRLRAQDKFGRLDQINKNTKISPFQRSFSASKPVTPCSSSLSNSQEPFCIYPSNYFFEFFTYHNHSIGDQM